jgi:hypothetical protein
MAAKKENNANDCDTENKKISVIVKMSVSDDGYLDPISENSHISTDGSEE